MKLAPHILAVCALAGLATGAFADPDPDPAHDPTGLWKGFTTYAGDILLVHPIFALELKDGKLSGKQIVVDSHDVEDDRPLLNAMFKDGVVSFDVLIPGRTGGGGFANSSRGGGGGGPGGRNAGGGSRGGMGGGGGGGGSRGGGGGGGGGRGAGGMTSDPFHVSDVTAGADGGYVTYKGTLMGGAIIGTHTKQTNGQGTDDNLEASWVAARITPNGIWDVTMHVLPDAGEPADKGSPLRAVKNELMRFDFKDLAITGVWKKSPVVGLRQTLPIKAVALTADGISFSVAIDNPAGKTVYEFKGSFIGTIANDVARVMPKVTFGPYGAQVDDPGTSLNQINGTVKITGPDGKVYNTKWRAERDDGKKARVEMGVPYELPPAAPGAPVDAPK